MRQCANAPMRQCANAPMRQCANALMRHNEMRARLDNYVVSAASVSTLQCCSVSSVRQGRAGHGMARYGKAGHGMARHGGPVVAKWKIPSVATVARSCDSTSTGTRAPLLPPTHHLPTHSPTHSLTHQTPFIHQPHSTVHSLTTHPPIHHSLSNSPTSTQKITHPPTPQTPPKIQKKFQK
jgi:hypothetical protein